MHPVDHLLSCEGLPWALGKHRKEGKLRSCELERLSRAHHAVSLKINLKITHTNDPRLVHIPTNPPKNRPHPCNKLAR